MKKVIDVLQAHFESLNPRAASVDFFREEERGQLLTVALEWASFEGRWQLVVRKEKGADGGTPPQVTRRPLVQLTPNQQRVALGAFFELMMMAASESSAPPDAVTEALATVAQGGDASTDVRRAFFG